MALKAVKQDRGPSSKMSWLVYQPDQTDPVGLIEKFVDTRSTTNPYKVFVLVEFDSRPSAHGRVGGKVCDLVAFLYPLKFCRAHPGTVDDGKGRYAPTLAGNLADAVVVLARHLKLAKLANELDVGATAC